MPFSSLDLLIALKKLDLLKNAPPLWWPNAGSFEVVVGAILTQNTRFEQALKSLQKLKRAGILSPDTATSLNHLAQINPSDLATHIIPSGFYNQKARYLCALSQNILEDFEDFEAFKEQASRPWLLEQKGIGQESADAILNYACLKPVMVVDKYTHQFLQSLGLEMEDYDAMQNFFMQGIEEQLKSALALYHHQLNLAGIYARFHGKIVACMRARIALKSHLKESYDLHWGLS